MKGISDADLKLAGLAVAAKREFLAPQPALDRGALAAALACVTAKAKGAKLLASMDSAGGNFTVVLVDEGTPGSLRAALLPRAFQSYDDALRFWLTTGSNLFLEGMLEDPWPSHVERFVQRITFSSWSKTSSDAPASLRWADAVFLLENQGDSLPALTESLIWLREADDLVGLELEDVQKVITAILDEAVHAHQTLLRLGPKWALRRAPILMPMEVLARRGSVKPMQAIAWWLCRDPYGPGLSQADAAHALGLGRSGKRQIQTHLQRALEKTQNEGPPPLKPASDDTPAVQSFFSPNIVLRGDPEKAPWRGRR